MSASDSPLNDEVAPLPRLKDVSLESLIHRKDAALRKAVERVRREASLGAQNYAAHSSSPRTDQSETTVRRGVGKS